MNEYNTECHTAGSLSWGAILGGIFSWLGIGVLLSLLGISVGMAFFEADSDTLANLGIGGIAWFIIGGTIAMFVCGWVAGQFANTRCLVRGGMHGFVAWGLSTVLGVALVSSGAGALVTGAGQLIGKTMEVARDSVSYVAPSAEQMAKDIDLSQSKTMQTINNQVNDLVKQAKQQAQKADQKANQAVEAVLNPTSETRQDLMKAVTTFMNNDNDAKAAKLRQTAIDQIVKNTNMNEDQAAQALDKWQKTYQQAAEQAKQKYEEAKAKAKEMSEDASNVLSGIALSAFFTLLIGAAAAIAGAAMATSVRRKRHQMHV